MRDNMRNFQSQFFLVDTEPVNDGTVNIQHRDNDATSLDGNDELGTGFRVARDMPRKLTDIGNGEKGARRYSIPAHTCANGDSYARGFAVEWPQYKFIAAAYVKTDPNDIGKGVVEKRCRVGKIGQGVVFTV